MDYGSYKFSDVGYSGIINSKLTLIWSDNTKLYQRLLKNSDKLLVMIAAARPMDTLYHMFKYENLRYCAVFNKMAGEMYICRIYREEDGLSVAASEILDDVDSVSHETLNLLTMISSVSKLVGDNEKCAMLLSGQSRAAEAIYNYCLSIRRKFEESDNPVYVQFRKRIFNTFGRINFLGRRLEKPLGISLDVNYECIRIDYEAVEMAIVNLAKIFYLGSSDEATGDFWIVAEEDRLRFSFEFEMADSYDASDYGSEIKTVKSIFALIGGQAVFEEADNMFVFCGSLPCECFEDTDNIPENDIIYLDEDSVEENEKNPNKFRKYYRKYKHGFLESPEAELEDVDIADYASIVLQCLNIGR